MKVSLACIQLHVRLGQGLGIVHINSYYMDAAYHCYADDQPREMENYQDPVGFPPSFFSELGLCARRHSFTALNEADLSIYLFMLTL